MRQFRDSAGVEWRVYLTERTMGSEARDHHFPEAYRQGWLVFESASEKRRLAPVPANWSELTDATLETLCSAASPQPARGKTTGESAAPPVSSAPRARGEPLRPQLDKAQEQLAESLEEVCDMPEVTTLDTGQLIRVEEALAVAADAAKEAVSLRRKMHADREQADKGEGPRGGERARGAGPADSASGRA